MEHMHQYVPLIERKIPITQFDNADDILVTTNCGTPILFGGDQLTVARIRLSKNIRDNAKTPTERLEGLVPAIQDWHIKQAILGVSLYYYLLFTLTL